MDIARQEKYKRNKFPEKEKISINYELDTLQIMCQYVLCPDLRKSQITNLDKLFKLLDMDAFKIFPDKQKRVRFIKKALRLRIDEGVTNPTLLRQYAEGGYEGKRANEIPLNIRGELTAEDIKYIDNTVATTLKYAYIHNNIQKIYTLSNRFLARDYPSMDATVNEFEELMNNMVSDFRKVKVETKEDAKFTLNPNKFTDIMTDIYNQVTDPSSRLYTGIKGLDELFGGGLEGGREYIFAGLAGVGKSLFLLDLALQIKKYNQFFSCKDKSKRPCIVMLTMENSLRETIERMVEMSIGSPMTDYSIENLIRTLQNQGQLVLSDQSPIDIIIKSKPNRSEDTNYLYTLTEDLADEGYEVVCMLQDHVKRIRAASGQTDIRLELGDVTNEFHNYAVIMDVPVVTLTHLNRDAANKIDEGNRNKQSDLIKLVGRSNIGESLLMMDNCDGFFLMSKEFDRDGNKYMGISRVKERYKCTNNSIMFFPYTSPTSIKLVEDKGMDFTAHKSTLLEINTTVRRETDSSKNMEEFTDEEQARNLRMKKLEENRLKRLEQQKRLGNPVKEKPVPNNNQYVRKKSYFDLPCRSDIKKAKEKEDYEKRKSYINFIRRNNLYNTDIPYTNCFHYGMKNGMQKVYKRIDKDTEYTDCFNYQYYNPYSDNKRKLKMVVRPVLYNDEFLQNKVFGYNNDLKVVYKRTS